MLVVIPARAGSERIKNKTLRRLGKHPLIAYTIASALEVSTHVVVATEDDAILECAAYYGARTWRRPMATATADAPDISWLSLFVRDCCGPQEAFVLRRLTSPFITASTISRAWHDLLQVPEATSLRAMRPANEHPQKMWLRQGSWVSPLIPWTGPVERVEAWSTPTQLLQRVYVQTAGLEILRRPVIDTGTLTGDKVLPWFFSDEQGLDLNTPNEWWMAEQLIEAKVAELPHVEQDPWVQHE